VRTGETRLLDSKAGLERALERWHERVGELPAATTDSGIAVDPLYGPTPDLFEHVGLPGGFPYTRGIYPSMYRGRLWTMRLYSGWGGPEDTNARFHYLLE